MNLLDIIILVILIAFVYKGAKQGITYMIGQAIGIMIGVLIASRIYEPIGKFLQPLFLGNYKLSLFFSFFIIFQFINEFVGLLLRYIGSVSFLNKLQIISNFESLDKWVGALLGLFVGNLVTGVVLYFLVHIPVSPSFDRLLSTSNLTPSLIQFASWYTALFPESFKNLPSVLNAK